jgi:hypothetical protein
MRSPRLHLKHRLIALAALAAVALVAAVAFSAFTSRVAQPAGQGQRADHAASDHDHAGDSAHTKPAYLRTLAVYTKREPAPSDHPERMRALLTAGKLPVAVVKATVATDENCEPDAEGVSHCSNKLKLANGRSITVRHPHRMHDVPCMTPGETVRVGRAVDA